MSEIKFSVAMSVYRKDNPEQLDLALKSICEQSYPADEIYLVIDGPIGKELSSIINLYSKQYGNFTINQLETNGGLGNALKIAVENARNDLIIRMDSDDISATGRFEKQIKAYIEKPVDVLGGWTLGFFGDLNTGDISAFCPPLDDINIKKAMQHTTSISHVTALFNRKAVLSVGNYQDLYYHEDYYLWVRMIEAGCTFRNIPEYVVYVRCGDGQASRHGGKKYYMAEKYLRRFMLKNNQINIFKYIKEMTIRFVYQMLMTSKMRSFIDMKIKRHYLSRIDADKIIRANGDF